MAALLERNILQLCSRERLMLTITFTRNSRYSRRFMNNDIVQDDVKHDMDLWKRSNKPMQYVKAARTDESNFATYNERVVRFQNIIMEEGKKSLARDLVNKAFEKMKRIQLEKYHNSSEEERKSIELNPYSIFYKAVENGRPVLQTRKIWKSGIYYDVPEACPSNRQIFICMRWLGEAGMTKERTIRFHDQLAKEIINLYNGQGFVIRKKQELHRKCEANKAFAQFKWK